MKDDKPDYIRIAREQFGCDDVLVIAKLYALEIDGSSDCLPATYVLGLKQNEELLMLVPTTQKIEPFVSEWQLCKQFRDIAKLIYGDDLEEIKKNLTRNDGYNAMTNISFYVDYDTDCRFDNEEFISKFENRAFDVEFVIIFENKYAVTQLDNEIMIYESDRNTAKT